MHCDRRSQIYCCTVRELCKLLSLLFVPLVTFYRMQIIQDVYFGKRKGMVSDLIIRIAIFTFSLMLGMLINENELRKMKK